jgi:5-methylcytosine-specific restriction protein A
MIGRKINEALNLGAKHSLFRKTGDFYQILTDFPGILIDLNGYVEFENRRDYEENVDIQRTERIHIPNGISSLPYYRRFSEEQLYIVNQVVDTPNADQEHLDLNNQAERRPRNIDSIIRNQNFVRKVKVLRENTCQICGLKLQIGPNSFYSEVHHIQPLGRPHNGPDCMENMICVCPNCHKKLDYGFIPIQENLENIPGHSVDLDFINYHNNRLD